MQHWDGHEWQTMRTKFHDSLLVQQFNGGPTDTHSEHGNFISILSFLRKVM